MSSGQRGRLCLKGLSRYTGPGAETVHQTEAHLYWLDPGTNDCYCWTRPMNMRE